MNNTKNQPNKQDQSNQQHNHQQHQQQKTRQEQGAKKQGQNPDRLYDDVKQHQDHEHPETRLTR